MKGGRDKKDPSALRGGWSKEKNMMINSDLHSLQDEDLAHILTTPSI